MNGAPLASWVDAAPFRLSPECLLDMGRTVVVSPHPDDETLGCGGLLSALHRAAGPGAAHVLMVSDGAASHPNSRRFPKPLLRQLRESETLGAMSALGWKEPADAVTFLRLPDGAVPGDPGVPAFSAAVEIVERSLTKLAPRTLMVPWRRDPHPDHRATSALVREALREAAVHGPVPRLCEYPIWLWARAESADLPRPGEVIPWRLNIRAELGAKRDAIAAHRSQTTGLIDDDPEGFRLTPELLARFERPFELFFDASPEPVTG